MQENIALFLCDEFCAANADFRFDAAIAMALFYSYMLDFIRPPDFAESLLRLWFNYHKPATAKARATPPTAHPALPVICDMPAVLVLLAAVADEVPEPPVVLGVFVPEGVDV